MNLGIPLDGSSHTYAQKIRKYWEPWVPALETAPRLFTHSHFKVKSFHYNIMQGPTFMVPNLPFPTCLILLRTQSCYPPPKRTKPETPILSVWLLCDASEASILGCCPGRLLLQDQKFPGIFFFKSCLSQNVKYLTWRKTHGILTTPTCGEEKGHSDLKSVSSISSGPSAFIEYIDLNV